MPPEERQRILAATSDADVEAFLYDWAFWARPTHQREDGTWTGQLAPPGKWRYWVVKAGRGYGKTRIGAEQVRSWARHYPLVNLIGATADDARDIMIEGESGLLAICPKSERPEYRPSKRRLEWPNGSKSLIFTADEPERLRGKQHMKVWADELGSWRYPEAWDQAMLGLRLGNNPQAVVTMTPKRTKAVRELLKNPNAVITAGTSYENRDNLAEAFFTEIITKYEGTTIGRQELNAELITDVPGAVWTLATIEANRVKAAPPLKRIGVAVDPSVSDTEDSAETGIIVGGLGVDNHMYVLEDASLRGSPNQRAGKAVSRYHEWRGDFIAVEVNNGGDWIPNALWTIDPNVKVATVHASRGKLTRAEPVGGLYEQGRIHHVGMFAELEDQMTSWVPGDASPDRMDALVWLATELMLGETYGPPGSYSYA